jgi:hypothetical protein
MGFVCAIPSFPIVVQPSPVLSVTPLKNMFASYKDYDGPCSAGAGCAGGVTVCLNDVDLKTGRRETLVCIDSDTQPATGNLGANVALPALPGSRTFWISVEIRRTTTSAGVDFHGITLS